MKFRERRSKAIPELQTESTQPTFKEIRYKVKLLNCQTTLHVNPKTFVDEATKRLDEVVGSRQYEKASCMKRRNNIKHLQIPFWTTHSVSCFILQIQVCFFRLAFVSLRYRSLFGLLIAKKIMRHTTQRHKDRDKVLCVYQFLKDAPYVRPSDPISRARFSITTRRCDSSDSLAKCNDVSYGADAQWEWRSVSLLASTASHFYNYIVCF